MNLLVTAGNTLTLIDRVRGITNIFSGRTGAQIAVSAHERGHSVTLFTSHPEVVHESPTSPIPSGAPWILHAYRTFDDLHSLMATTIPGGAFDTIIHCSAVSDYQSAGIYAPAPGTRFSEEGRWQCDRDPGPSLLNRAAGKVKSDEPELWLRLVRTPKLIDLVRSDWGFRGILVKFKLEVGVDDDQLLAIAEHSRRQSAADLMVANTLDGSSTWAYLGPLQRDYQRVSRRDLPARLLDAVEQLHGKPSHG